jgi:DNA-binding NarL/FixJ family response regulator
VLRAVARVRLEAAGADAVVAVAHRHVEWVADLAADVGADDARQPALFARARAERANIWAALQHCVDHPEDAARGIAICRDLWAFWHCARPVSEIVRLLESLIERVPDGSHAHATGVWVAASLLAVQRDLERADEVAVRALALGRALGDPEVVAWSTLVRAHVRWYGGNWAEADRIAADALALTRLMHMPFATLVALYSLAAARFSTGDIDASDAFCREAVAVSEGLGETWLRSYVLNQVGHILLRRGEIDEAERLTRTCLEYRRELGDGVGLRHTLELRVEIEAKRRAWERAAVLAGAADAVWRAIAGGAVRSVPAEFEDTVAASRTALGQAAFDDAYGRGQALGLDGAIELGLSTGRTSTPRPAARRPAGPLSARELEVARLVADGASNSETAARLFISERTVESHVASIFNKLGLDSRVQVARWVAALDTSEA